MNHLVCVHNKSRLMRRKTFLQKKMKLIKSFIANYHFTFVTVPVTLRPWQTPYIHQSRFPASLCLPLLCIVFSINCLILCQFNLIYLINLQINAQLSLFFANRNFLNSSFTSALMSHILLNQNGKLINKLKNKEFFMYRK